MTCSFFTNQNFLDQDFVNTRTVSSENANFPASNLYDNNQRTKVWRTTGNYVIDASNKTMVFRETDAVDLTATLTEDRYTSAAALALEIKTQLEAVGASVYTVEIDLTTGKWKLTSDGSGGDGRFELVWTDIAMAGVAAVLGFGVSSDDTGSLVYTADYLSIHTDEWLLWDLGLPSLPDAIYIFGDKDSPIPLSPSASIVIEGNHTDNFATAVFSQAVPYDSRVLAYYSETGFGSDYLRYWRFKIVDSQNPNGYIQLGYAFLGSILKPTRGRIAFGFTGNNLDFSDFIRVVGGQIYSNRRSKTKQYSLDWQGLTKADVELLQDHFESKGLTETWICSIDQDEAFSTAKERFINIVRYQAEPSFTLVSANNFTMRMVLEEAL